MLGAEDDDDENDVSSLDIERERGDERNDGKGRELALTEQGVNESGYALTLSEAEQQVAVPTMMDIPVMVDAFDAMPDDLKTYVMYQFLRRCAKPTLHFVANVVNPALKIDFLGLLPLELSLNIISHLDAQSMCRAAQVSKKWRQSWMDVDSKPKHIAFRAHQRHVVTCLQFDTDKILTGSDDTNINVYDTKTGALRTRLSGHEGGVWALQYWGNVLVSGSTDRSVRVWDIEKGKCLQVFQGHTSTVRCLVILQPTEIGKDPEGKPIMMPERPLIITGSRDSSLRVWKLPSLDDPGIFQATAPSNDRDNPYFIRALTGHHHSVRAIAAHGDTLVSGSYDTSVRVWKISTGEVLHRLNGHTQKVYSVVLDHARNRCISGSMDNLVKVWSLETGACLFNLEGHTSLVGLLDLSHERLVSAAADSTLRIWDPENGQCKATLTAHTGAITCFQHDGQKVISGSDRTLKMWNVKTGECVKDLLTDLSGVWQVKFNERRCVAAVQRNSLTYIEVLDFGASRDGAPEDQRGRRIVVDGRGREIEDVDETVELVEAQA
ncbi:hypothetical protein GTA08_BOTSDO11659 [Neofusicoccum parvum]|uniref:Uncharacterized protein n=1 Tax=Neofusicoccum parvum TaxID=310453 RepID=A0ACB5RQD7_9PEZI|nr:hypothetical protein GTA08_BOTSDO11659 [Neofusicoccum parvum]